MMNYIVSDWADMILDISRN